MQNYIIPIFVPHQGCGHDCTFCNQKSISGQMKNVTGMEVRNTIEEYLKSFREEYSYVEVAFYGGSFTGIELEKQEELLGVAHEYIREGKVDSVRISTRPDYISKNILKMLKRYGVKTIELGVQSTNNYILKQCKRGHTFEDVKKASKLIRRKRFDLGHQMMVGLPESTRIDELNTAKELAKLKPKSMRIYPVLVIKNTELEREFVRGDYIPLTLTQAVERCKDVYCVLSEKKINIIRVGLQNTDIISNPEKNDESQVAAGPYHEAFGQLVEDSMWYESILERIKKYNVKVKEVEIEINPANVGSVVGHKRENIEKLKEWYDVEVKIRQDKNIKMGKFEMKVLQKYEN